MASSAFLSLNEAAEDLNVHYMTAYRYVRTGRLLASKENGQWRVARSDLATFMAATGSDANAENSPPAALGKSAARVHLVEPLARRLAAGDLAGSWDLINGALGSGASPVEIHEKLLAPAMVLIGEGWAAGELTIADEHRASAAAQRLIGRMGVLFRHRGQRRGTIVVGAAVNDRHGLPTMMLADMLCDRGFDVVDLGADTPTESFVEVAESVDRLVGVGVCISMENLRSSTAEQLRSIRLALPDAFLAVGGRAVDAGTHAVFAEWADDVTTSGAAAVEMFTRIAALPQSA